MCFSLWIWDESIVAWHGWGDFYIILAMGYPQKVLKLFQEEISLSILDMALWYW